MPYGRKTQRKTNRRRRNYRRPRRPNTVARPMRPAVYSFKRSTSEVVQLNTQTVPLGWTASGNALCKNLNYKLSDLPDYLEFVKLFRRYKINAVRVQMYFSNTGSTEASNPLSSETPQIQNANNQIMWVCPSPAGNSTIIGPDQMLQIQSAKRRPCLNGDGKPISIVSRVRQLGMRYGGEQNTDFAVVKPRFVSTQEPHTIHYGQSICFERADQSVFANNSHNYQTVRIIYTYYFQCKQVM